MYLYGLCKELQKRKIKTRSRDRMSGENMRHTFCGFHILKNNNTKVWGPTFICVFDYSATEYCDTNSHCVLMPYLSFDLRLLLFLNIFYRL